MAGEGGGYGLHWWHFLGVSVDDFMIFRFLDMLAQ